MALRLSLGLRKKRMGHAAGDDFKTLFATGMMRIYSGSQPATASAAEQGTLLCTITQGGVAYNKSSASTVLVFGNADSSGAVNIASSDTWQGTAVATGTAGWFRFYSSSAATGVDSSGAKVRFDGAVGTSGSQLNVSSTSFVSGATITIDTFSVTLPAS